MTCLSLQVVFETADALWQRAPALGPTGVSP